MLQSQLLRNRKVYYRKNSNHSIEEQDKIADLAEKGINEGIWKQYCPVKYAEIPSQLVKGTIDNAVVYRVSCIFLRYLFFLASAVLFIIS